MKIGLLLFEQILIMFIFMGLGTFLYKKKLVNQTGSKQLGAILINLVIPSVILRSFWIEFTTQKFTQLLQSMVLAFIALLISILIAHFFLKKNGIEDCAVAFSNAGFIGIPLVSAVLHEGAVFFITALIAELVILQMTYGVYLLSKNKNSLSLKNIFKNPVVLAFITSILLFVLQVPQPSMASAILNPLAQMNSPLAMIILGTYFAQTQIKSLFNNIRLYWLSILRLILIPLITIVVLYALPFGSNEMKLAILISASAPCGANVAIFAQQTNQDYTYAVQIVSTTTLLSLVLLPCIITFANYLLV